MARHRSAGRPSSRQARLRRNANDCRAWADSRYRLSLSITNDPVGWVKARGWASASMVVKAPSFLAALAACGLVELAGLGWTLGAGARLPRRSSLSRTPAARR